MHILLCTFYTVYALPDYIIANSRDAHGAFAFSSFYVSIVGRRTKGTKIIIITIRSEPEKRASHSERSEWRCRKRRSVTPPGRRGFMMAVLSRAAPWTVLAWCDPRASAAATVLLENMRTSLRSLKLAANQRSRGRRRPTS